MTQKTQVKWTPSEIETLHLLGGKCLPHELQHFLPRHSQTGIMAKRRRLGIELDDSYFSRVGKYAAGFRNNDNLCVGDQKTSLDDLPYDATQILLGSILGDGCIKLSSGKAKRYVFYEGHHRAQTDYVAWKCEKLAALGTRFYNTASGGKPSLQTTAYKFLTELRQQIYGNGSVSTKTYIPIDIFSQLDLFGLLIWYLDDGHLGYSHQSSNKYHSPSIAAKGWAFNDLSELVQYLNIRFGLSLYVYLSKHREGQNKTVRFTAGDKKKVFPIWQQLFCEYSIPQCMDYKIDVHRSGNL